MWLMTTRGFYSAVQHRDDPDLLMVRARDRSDLVRLLELIPRPTKPEILYTATADYPYRVTMPRRTWIYLLGELAREIDYPNFKDAVTAKIGHKHHDAYMRVWGVMRDLEGRVLPAKVSQLQMTAWREYGDCSDCGTPLLVGEAATGVCIHCASDR